MKCIIRYILMLSVAIVMAQESALNSSDIDAHVEKVCNLKLKFLKEHDKKGKLTQILSIAQEIMKLAANSQEQSDQKMFTLEKELAVLTVLYLKDMRPEDVLKLSQLADQCRQVISQLPEEHASKWRQKDIYRIFLSS